MSFVTEKQPRPSKVNGNRHDTREPNLDHKKFGPALGKIREPHLVPEEVDKFLERQKALLLAKKDEIENSNKPKGLH